MSYIKYLDIAGVESDGEVVSRYLKRVNVVEILDEEGNVWEPVPGPDPWDELVVQMESTWANHNNYVEGNEIYADVAQFTGGSDQTTYRYRWQTKDPGGEWVNGAWVSYHGALEAHTIADEGMVRLQSQARDDADDPVTVVNSTTSAQSIVYVNPNFSINGDAFAGEELICGTPSITGGTGPYTKVFNWSNGATGQKITLVNSDVGETITCTVTATDKNGNTKDVTAQNSIGPIEQYTLGTVNGTVDGVSWDAGDDTVFRDLDSNALISLGMSGNSPNISYVWEVRTGNARLSDQGNGFNAVTFTHTGYCSIQGNAYEPHASDTTAESLRFEFFVPTPSEPE